MAFTERMATRTSISGAAIAQFTFVAGPASDGQIDPCGDGARACGVADFTGGHIFLLRCAAEQLFQVRSQQQFAFHVDRDRYAGGVDAACCVLFC